MAEQGGQKMERPDFVLSIFVLGCAGALAPEIVRLYKLRTKKHAFEWSWFYLVISLFFSGLGGLIAWILPATTYYAAFYAGVTAPVFITAVLKQSKTLGEREYVQEFREILRKREEAKEETGKAEGEMWSTHIPSPRNPRFLLNDFVNAL